MVLINSRSAKKVGGSRDLPDVQTVADHAGSFPRDGRPDEGGNLNTEWVADTLLGDETLIETVDGRGQDDVAFDMTCFIRVDDGQVDISMNGAVCYLVYVSLASLLGGIYLVIGIYQLGGVHPAGGLANGKRDGSGWIQAH